MFDLIVRGGTVHDGLGNAPRIADVGIVEGRIAAVGTLSGPAREEIDASGLLVTPGFVDVHTHYDGQATWENRMIPSSHHGVTTVVTGNCGVGFAPCKPEQREMLVAVMEGVEDVPEVVMTEGLPWTWETYPEYLDTLETRSFDIDVATQVPHSAIRVYVMGERAAAYEPPSADDLASMRALTAEAVRAGAFGVTTSRNMLHRTVAGQLAPSLFSEEDELVELSRGLSDAGAGVFQMIPSITGPAKSEFAVMRRIARESGRPLSYSLLQLPTGREEEWRESLEELDAANADGLTMRAQVAPRPVGMLYGLDLSFHPFCLHPSFRALRDKPLAEKVAALRDPALREQLLSEEPEDSNPVSIKTVKNFKFAYPMSDPPNYEPALADRIDQRAIAAGMTPEEYAYDLLLEQDGRAIFYNPGANYRDGNLDAVREMLGNSHAIVGLADGGAHYGMICDGSFPTYYLCRWARDAAPGQRLSVAEAVAGLTSKPADALGLTDRGRIVAGAKADLNLIDFDRLRLHLPAMRQDLPAGGKRLHQAADGYVATIVSGTVTYREGEHTGALPGKLVRRGAGEPRLAA